ncbi:ATP-binding protein [Pseudomonas gingeri]|uniref:ATP-binding protein n=1 Tax=Pseudomonas gingeri TaxID=117681 RepID=UPI00210B74A1|nr:ATP-binding protein [Pseudomonas gingeri]
MFEPRRWMAIVAGLLWTALTLYLLWLSAGASVAVSEASFRRLMTGPGYLIAQQLKPLSAKQREVRLDVLRQHFQYPVNLVERDSIDVPPEADTMLEHHEAVQDVDEEIAYYPLDDETLIQFGPMWVSASLDDFFVTPIYWFTAFAAGAPVLVFLGLGWRRRRQHQRDMTALAACLGGMVRTPTVTLPPVGKEWRPLLLTLQQHAQDIAAMSERHKEVSQAVSHELRTPLARLRFALVLLTRSEDEATRKRLQERLQVDIEELESLVRASLTFAKLAGAPANLNNEPILIQSWLQNEFALLDDNRHRLELETDPPGLELIGDSALLHLIVRNLLGNAVAYARSHVRISALRQGENHLVLHVDDDGPGILAEDREKIFEPFVRLSSGLEQPGGFGLGLALAQRAAHWHRGELSVSRGPLGGARFSLVLPLRPD